MPNQQGYLFMTLETRCEDGREQLVMVEPPQRKESTIPSSRTQNSFPRGRMKNTARAKRAAQRRSGGPSSRRQLDFSGHDDHAPDCQINMEGPMRAVPTSESPAIPITVETHQQPHQTAQPSHVSTDLQQSFDRPSIANTAASGGNHWAASLPSFGTSSSDGLESENPTSNGQQSPLIENYSSFALGNSLDSNFFPHHQPGYGQDVIDSQRRLEVAGAPPSWPATNSENHIASSAHQFPGETQFAVTSPNSACSHVYFERVIHCALCGCIFSLDGSLGVSGSAPHEQAAHHHSHPLENAGLGLAGAPVQAAHIQAPSPTNGLPCWTQSQNTMPSFSHASTSEHSVEPRRFTVDAASWPPDTVPTRLSIPDYAHHRDYPSAAVSASTFPGGSSDFFPTPASTTFHDFASPQINNIGFRPSHSHLSCPPAKRTVTKFQ